jgi:hypothetical protein
VNQRLGKMADAANWTAQLLPSGQTLAPIRHLLRNPACTPEARGGRWWLAICALDIKSVAARLRITHHLSISIM